MARSGANTMEACNAVSSRGGDFLDDIVGRQPPVEAGGNGTGCRGHKALQGGSYGRRQGLECKTGSAVQLKSESEQGEIGATQLIESTASAFVPQGLVGKSTASKLEKSQPEASLLSQEQSEISASSDAGGEVELSLDTLVAAIESAVSAAVRAALEQMVPVKPTWMLADSSNSKAVGIEHVQTMEQGTNPMSEFLAGANASSSDFGIKTPAQFSGGSGIKPKLPAEKFQMHQAGGDAVNVSNSQSRGSRSLSSSFQLRSSQKSDYTQVSD